MNIEFEVLTKKCSDKEYSVPNRKWWCCHKHDCTEQLCPLGTEERYCECREYETHPKTKYCADCGGRL